MDRYLLTTFRENLRAILIEKNWTQRQASYNLEVPYCSLNKLLRGDGYGPSLTTVETIGENLEIDPILLLRPGVDWSKSLEKQSNQ